MNYPDNHTIKTEHFTQIKPLLLSDFSKFHFTRVKNVYLINRDAFSQYVHFRLLY